jgi:hypothetical protein
MIPVLCKALLWSQLCFTSYLLWVEVPSDITVSTNTEITATEKKRFDFALSHTTLQCPTFLKIISILPSQLQGTFQKRNFTLKYD